MQKKTIDYAQRAKGFHVFLLLITTVLFCVAHSCDGIIAVFVFCNNLILLCSQKVSQMMEDFCRSISVIR